MAQKKNVSLLYLLLHIKQLGLWNALLYTDSPDVFMACMVLLLVTIQVQNDFWSGIRPLSGNSIVD
jgi:hypothetical protein